jgi:hypothetical protein
MQKPTVKHLAVTGALVLGLGASLPAAAYMCKGVFNEAEKNISEAESKVTPKSDSRIKAMIAEAKGLLESGRIAHDQAAERHVGEAGKYAHGDAVRKARWAADLAKEAIFLATGDPR